MRYATIPASTTPVSGVTGQCVSAMYRGHRPAAKNTAPNRPATGTPASLTSFGRSGNARRATHRPVSRPRGELEPVFEVASTLSPEGRSYRYTLLYMFGRVSRTP